MNTKTVDELVTFVYGVEAAPEIIRQLAALVAEFYPAELPSPAFFDQNDIVLITYGDMVRQADERPLSTLHQFLAATVRDLINTVHILPFYPYSSDDGFSVIDYVQVDPALGDWEDIHALSGDFALMFDAVINHISQQSSWYQAFLNGEAAYRDYFVVVDPSADLTAVFRPRALSLLTPAETKDGIKHVWTTFSADQIDLNFGSPAVMLEIMRVLLTYVQHGAKLIRLDAIGFMWKQIGTRSLHLPQTHALIQLFRLVLNQVDPSVALVTETNVPHHENVSYFGNGRNEAQMVYNFSLPPLILHAFHTGNATALSEWAAGLTVPSDQTTFFNFCASHDGIGVTPARGILPDEAIATMAQRVEALHGRVSYKTNSDGSLAAYELNINYLDALGDPDADETDALIVRRFLTSQASMLALRGVPGIYFHSLFGSRSWQEGSAMLGHNRAINRQKFERDVLEAELQDGFRQTVFAGYTDLIKARRSSRAFHPNASQTILNLHTAVFAIVREGEGETAVCLHNVSNQPVTLQLAHGGTNLLNGNPVPAEIELNAYATLWYAPEK